MSILDHWDIARFTLGALIVLCNWGVWRGVKLEESFIPWEKETGKRLLVNSLAWEFAFAMALLVVDTVGGVRQKLEIAALNAEIAPRRLSLEQQTAIGKDLLPFKGKSIVLMSYTLDAEGAVLGFQITDAFKKGLLSTNNEGLMTVVGGAPIALGIHVTGNDAPLVEALLKTLGEYQIVSPAEPFPGGFITTGNAHPIFAPPDALVFVGIKPIRE
jgi:hypothetical protein